MPSRPARDSKLLRPSIVVSENEKQMGILASRAIVDSFEKRLQRSQRVVALLESGPGMYSTWHPMVKYFKRAIKAGRIDPQKLDFFSMGEYAASEKWTQYSLESALNTRLLQPIGMRNQNVHLFGNRTCVATAIEFRKAVERGGPSDVITDLECRLQAQFDEAAHKIAAEFSRAGGAFDIVVTSIGRRASLGFNEFANSNFADTRATRIVRLSRALRRPYLDKEMPRTFDDFPTHAFTFTLPPILNAKRIHVINPGADSARIVARTLKGPIAEDSPASWLLKRDIAGKVRFYLDKDSSRLSDVAKESIKATGYCTVRELIVPERPSLLSDNKLIDRLGIPRMRLPEGQTIAILDEKDTEYYLRPLVDLVKKNNRVLHVASSDRVKRILNDCPDVLIAARHSTRPNTYTKKFDKIVKEIAGLGVTALFYFPLESVGYEIHYFFSNETMKKKIRNCDKK
jgi:6-phosphogluconolactonase/glucosamine-6-phosphate isomerase/deaminase